MMGMVVMVEMMTMTMMMMMVMMMVVMLRNKNKPRAYRICRRMANPSGLVRAAPLLAGAAPMR
jgi:hypothetical protein